MYALGSGHEPRVLGSSLASGSPLSGRPASPSALPPPAGDLPSSHSLSEINKIFKKKLINVPLGSHAILITRLLVLICL